MESGDHSIENKWYSSPTFCPNGRVYVFPMALPPEYPGPCAVPLTIAALLLNAPKFSIMSISPQAGHPAVPMFSPSIQKAGQTPRPKGNFMRATMRPYCQLRSVVCVDAPGLPVCNRADV